MTLLISLLVLPLGAVVAWGVITMATRERTRPLHETLAPYSVSTPSDAAVGTIAGPGGDLVETPFLQRYVAAVAEMASRRGVLQYLKRLLDQADLPIRPAEALFVYVAGVLLGGSIGLLVANAFVGLVCLACLAVLPWMALQAAAARRTKAFTTQLPDMLQLLGTTLRSGFSILQGLDTVSQQLKDPIGKEIRHVCAEARLGRPLVEALTEVAQRVRSEDFQWVVTSIGIQREVGGNLAELLDIVADTMNSRARLRREASTLTAEGRIGAVVISILPVAIGLFVYSVNPGYLSPLLHEAFGEILFYGSIIMAVLGIFWLRKLVNIEV
ncbi:MAG: type II secretion system F family protein [Acidimicrobiales bacterium]|jgi:tight adherence protein B